MKKIVSSVFALTLCLTIATAAAAQVAEVGTPDLDPAGDAYSTHVAGAYWLGDERNPMLTRIYGTCFWDKKALKKHLADVEEAKKRDHRKLGKELDLFSFHHLAPAMPFFHPKGAVIYNQLVDFVRRYYRTLGFGEVLTPQVVDADLFKASGHYDNYKENMFFVQIDEREACGDVLGVLNNPRSAASSYCGGTTIRGGWAGVECGSKSTEGSPQPPTAHNTRPCALVNDIPAVVRPGHGGESGHPAPGSREGLPDRPGRLSGPTRCRSRRRRGRTRRRRRTERERQVDDPQHHHRDRPADRRRGDRHRPRPGRAGRGAARGLAR